MKERVTTNSSLIHSQLTIHRTHKMKNHLLKILTAVLFLASCSSSTQNKNGDTADSVKNKNTAGDTAIVYASKAFTVKVYGKGAPVIFIPGFASSGEVWNETVKKFSEKYECHVLTLSGFGGEPPLAEPSLLKVKNEIIDYVKENKLNHPIIIGHSLGGEMAVWLSESEPTLFSKAIIVDALPFYSLLFDSSATSESVKPRAEQMKTGMLSTNMTLASAKQTLQFMITDSANIALAANWDVASDKKTMAQYIYDLITLDLRNDLSKIKIPVLVLGSWASTALYGGSPAQTKKDYTSYYKAVANCKVDVALKAKHFIMLDQPEWFYKEVTDFLK